MQAEKAKFTKSQIDITELQMQLKKSQAEVEKLIQDKSDLQSQKDVVQREMY